MKSLVVLCTVPTLELAKIMANGLVKEKLAACVNIIPNITSVYEWDDKICEDKEFLLMIKTNASKYPKLESKLLATHRYEVPEIIALPIERGSRAYLKWLGKFLKT